MLRIAGSLVTGTVRAYDLIRALGRDGNPTPLGQAFAEYGPIPGSRSWSGYDAGRRGCPAGA